MDRRAFCAGGIPLKRSRQGAFTYIEENGDKKLRRIRLEVELENGRAISLYKKMGFEPAPYDGMWKTIL